MGTTGTFSTPQLWEDGAPTDLTTAEKSACGTFAVATFVQGEALTFVGSGATGKMLDTDSTGVGTGTYMIYGITTGNPAASDVITGGTSTATCILTSGTADHVGVIWQGQQQNQTFSGAGTQLNMAGSSPGATTYKEYTTVAGASFRDHANVQTNALRYNTSNGAAIEGTTATVIVLLGESFARIANMQINGTTTNSITVDSVSSSTRVSNCILECPNTSAGTTSGVLVMRSTGGHTISNTLVVNRITAADHIVATNLGSPSFFNCTFVAADDLATAPTSVLLAGATGTVTVQNCGLFAGDSTKAIKAGSATFNFTTCYSDISGTSGVTQTTYANEFQNVNNATRDFRLKTGAAQKDTGTTDATNAAIDIAGTARPSGAAYDVGAWELVAAGGGAPVLVECDGRWL